ncbi:hypothetical protein PFISCL1PPCAC_23362, partial [Pristionchus fissidentatus]
VLLLHSLLAWSASSNIFIIMGFPSRCSAICSFPLFFNFSARVKSLTRSISKKSNTKSLSSSNHSIFFGCGLTCAAGLDAAGAAGAADFEGVGASIRSF